MPHIDVFHRAGTFSLAIHSPQQYVSLTLLSRTAFRNRFFAGAQNDNAALGRECRKRKGVRETTVPGTLVISGTGDRYIRISLSAADHRCIDSDVI